MGIAATADRTQEELLLAIASAVDETGSCRSVTQDDLAASCGCTVRQGRRLVNELAAERYLAHPQRGRRGGGRARGCSKERRGGWIITAAQYKRDFSSSRL